MRHVRITSTVVELGDYDFYRLISRSLTSLHEIAEGLAGQHRLGVPDILGTVWRAVLMQGLTDLEESLQPHFNLDDGELREEFDLLFESLHRLSEADEQMVKWLARWANISSVQQVPSRRRLYQKLTRQAEKRMLAGALPEWVSEPMYQSFLSESEQAATRITETTKLIDQRLRQILGVPTDAQIMVSSRWKHLPRRISKIKSD